MSRILRRVCTDNTGATAIEYGLIVSLIVIAIMGSIGVFAGNSIDMWNGVSTKVTAANTAAN